MGNKGRLTDDQRARYARTRSVVLDGEISVRMLVVSPESGKGCHNHSVLEGHGANLDWLEKLGCGHCNASVCFRGFLRPIVPT